MYFPVRSYQKELLDQDDIPFEDIRQNMKELDFINTWLGGHQITLNGLKKMTGIASQAAPLHICEIGCGGGDNLRVLEAWCKKKKIPAVFTGIDKKQECITFAQSRTQLPGYTWIASDYAAVDFGGNKPDIIFSSLFCHHFADAELEKMMQWMQQNSRRGFFINDLHRHVLAYYSIKWLTKIFSKSYLVKNDAPLSVQRGFSKKDWQRIMQRASIKNYSIKWKWAFRWLITTT